MAPWHWLAVALLALVARCLWRLRQFQRWQERSWPNQIAVLKTDTPLELPPVKALKATPVRPHEHLLRFHERMVR